MFEIDQDNDITPFYIARRGSCSFVKKVRNMERIGVAVAIIVNDGDTDIDEVIMSDDGTGGSIRIPAMLISKEEGEKLIDFLLTETQEVINSAALKASFVMEKPDNRVEYDIWYTSSNDRALDFISEFASKDAIFGEKVLMAPHYVFWRCKDCEGTFVRDDCFASGMYCAVESATGHTKGTDILLEDIRQKCLYNQLYGSDQREQFWKYMKHVHANCYESIN